MLACLLASIQPRTSLVKFARSPRRDPPGIATRRLMGRWSVPRTTKISRLIARTLRQPRTFPVRTHGAIALISVRSHGVTSKRGAAQLRTMMLGKVTSSH